MSRIKAVLAPSGTLSGYTIIEPEGGANTSINMSTNFTARKISLDFFHLTLKMSMFSKQYFHQGPICIFMQPINYCHLLKNQISSCYLTKKEKSNALVMRRS